MVVFEIPRCKYPKSSIAVWLYENARNHYLWLPNLLKCWSSSTTNIMYAALKNSRIYYLLGIFDVDNCGVVRYEGKSRWVALVDDYKSTRGDYTARCDLYVWPKSRNVSDLCVWWSTTPPFFFDTWKFRPLFCVWNLAALKYQILQFLLFPSKKRRSCYRTALCSL